MPFIPSIPGVPALLSGTGIDTGIGLISKGSGEISDIAEALGPLAPRELLQGVQVLTNVVQTVNRAVRVAEQTIGQINAGIKLVNRAAEILGVGSTKTSLKKAVDNVTKGSDAISNELYFTIILKDSPSLPGATGPTWGIFTLAGAPALVPDSVVRFEYVGEYRVPDYPIEDGSFESYNKVAIPYGVRITFAKGGSDAERTAFLNAAQTVLASIDLFTVITPEISYDRANVVRMSLDRSAEKGAKLLQPELQIQEIRQAAGAKFSNTKTPSGASRVGARPVQGVTVPNPSGVH